MQSRLDGPRRHQSFPVKGTWVLVLFWQSVCYQHRTVLRRRWREMRAVLTTFHAALQRGAGDPR
jgi:hypothetical protein